MRGDRDSARGFYKKYIDVGGMAVMASGDVADLALQRTWWIVTHMLAGRSDILQAMVKNGTRLIIIGKDQVYTDMPEYRNSPNPEFQNERVRGTGGFGVTSFGEENLLSLPLDRYDDESIAVHEFCHTIDSALRAIDPTWTERRNANHQRAREMGCYKDTYAGSNAAEYWAEIAQAYFDCNRVNNWNHGPVGTRADLQRLDPEGYAWVHATFNLKPDQDWRYTWLQKLPSVTAPPAKFKIDPYYTRFTWAREFPVIGRQADGKALLAANDTIRKMFAYRHDILKALIAEGARLVVLGKKEKISNLPEMAKIAGRAGFDPRARGADYNPETKLLVVDEKNLSGKGKSGSEVIRRFAKAIHQVTGTRPVDPNWEKRPRQIWQQYELRVQRMDVRFDEKLKQLHEAAAARGLWIGTPAARDRVEYWMAGVLAYFDAAGQARPKGAPRDIATREALKDYDSGLYSLVSETMAYEGRVDWRYTSTPH
jgi:alpha-glucosidase